MDPIEVGIGIAIASGAIGTVVTGTLVVRALLRRWTERTPAVPTRDIDELRPALRGLVDEVVELQERVDFTEHVLAQGRDAAQPREPS